MYVRNLKMWGASLREVSRSERQRHANGLVPIFPVVLSVAYAQLTLDTLLPHQLVEIHIEVEEKVVVTTVDEPLD